MTFLEREMSALSLGTPIESDFASRHHAAEKRRMPVVPLGATVDFAKARAINGFVMTVTSALEP